MSRITANFLWNEALRSEAAARHGIANTPTEKARDAILVAATGMEKVRALLGNYPITPNSWYRNAQVNKLVGGSKTSDHMTGYSVDFSCPKFGTLEQQYKKLVDNKELLQYDQIIIEEVHIHISFAPARRLQDLKKLGPGNYVPAVWTPVGKLV